MDAIDALFTRASIGPAFLAGPGPEGEALRTILAAGTRAPDHGKLRHWRFLVIRGEARARLGEVFAEGLRRRDPSATPPMIEKEFARPLKAPLVVAVAARIDKEHPKIPEVEQLLSAGAAVENMLLAAHALGFGAKWLTGEPAYDPYVWAALGLAPGERLIGFVHVGTATAGPPPMRRPEPEAHVREWTGPAAPGG